MIGSLPDDPLRPDNPSRIRLNAFDDFPIRVGALLMLSLAVTIAGCSSGGAHTSGTTYPHGSAPTPSVAQFLPKNDKLISAKPVNLDGSNTPQLAVTATATSTAPRATASTVLLLKWDSTGKRWMVVFDASQQPLFALPPLEAKAGRLDLVAHTPHFAVVHDQTDGSADLVYWLNSPNRSVSVFRVGVIHETGHGADLVWTLDADGTDTAVSNESGVAVEGVAPSQRMRITLPWVTQTDPSNIAVRPYSFVVAPTSTSASDRYSVISDDRPLVGVGIVAVPHSTKARVSYLPAGSPASGLLQLGDVIDGIDGIRPSNPHHLVPAVVDEVARHYPGDTVALGIERLGHRSVVKVKLGQWDFQPGQTGYRGASSATLGVYLQLLGTSVEVNAVVPGGPADTAGVPGGSVLTSVNGLPIRAIADVQAALVGTTAGDTATIGYVTADGAPATTSVGLGPPTGTPPALFTL